MLALDITDGRVRVLCDADGGAVRDPCVSYDGKRILFSWARDAEHCFQNWLSCATCHPNARADGLNWDLQNDGVGTPKNTKSLFLSHATPLIMTTGARDHISDAIAAGFRGLQFIVPHPVTERDVLAYLQSLEQRQSPHRLRDGTLSESASRGEVLLNSAEVGCSACHSGQHTTDLKRHDVGTSVPRGRATNLQFDTPTLTETWRTAPYLHDGRATTITAVLTKHNHGDCHGRTSHLSRQELRDLAEFVLSQ